LKLLIHSNAPWVNTLAGNWLRESDCAIHPKIRGSRP